MSVLIKGMEMPKDCNNCKFFDDNCDYPTCSVTDNSRGYNWNPRGQRMPDCPLVEVPPHGRLIDADEFEVQDGWLRDSKYFAQESSHTHITFVYSNDIYNAPTVIPADKDGET